jgi:prepilin-type N-terminal cleavage/methylation domain-containing protein/prepilin-type processing-associated H-X9-DG protein
MMNITHSIAHPQTHKSKGFTIIELLVVIFVVALLAGIIVAALGGSRERAVEVRGVSNLRQLSLGINMTIAEQGTGRLRVRSSGEGSGPQEYHLWSVQLERRFGIAREVFFCDMTPHGLDDINASRTVWAFRTAWGLNQTPQVTWHKSRAEGEWEVADLYLSTLESAGKTLMLGSVLNHEGRGRHSIDLLGTGSGNHSGSIQLRYRDRAAAAFFDGHVALLDAQEVANLGFTAAYGKTNDDVIALPSPQD